MKNLRILLITQGMSRLVRPLFDSGYTFVGVLESMPRDYGGPKKKFTIISLLKKLYTIAKKRNISLSDFCSSKNIPYNIIWKKNTKEVADWVEKLNPDLIVVFSMSQLLREDVLNIPRLGTINLHPSFLPDYRGPNPDFWQYYDMEMNPGATVHYVNAGEDTGDIIYQERVHIPLGTKSPARLDILIGELGVSLMLKAIDAIAQNNAPRKLQPIQNSTVRARNLRHEEHSQIIDWENWPVERIWHIFRGTEQWLNAIEQPSGLMAGQRWSIQEYEKTETPTGMLGKIGKYKNKKCVFAKNGVVYVGVDFDAKKSILRILKR